MSEQELFDQLEPGASAIVMLNRLLNRALDTDASLVRAVVECSEPDDTRCLSLPANEQPIMEDYEPEQEQISWRENRREHDRFDHL